jgi:hypothetical protein
VCSTASGHTPHTYRPQSLLEISQNLQGTPIMIPSTSPNFTPAPATRTFRDGLTYLISGRAF